MLLIWLQGARGFGGRFRVAVSMIIELLFSMLLAPVRMLFHSRFVSAAFLGIEMTWKSPPRQDSETHWDEGMRKHGMHTLLGLVWGGGVFLLDPSYLPWLLPIAGALVLSIPISVLSSRVSLGRMFRRMKLFLIPEEAEPPRELLEARAHAGATPAQPGFVEVAVDPLLNALACASARPRDGVRRLSEKREKMMNKVLHSDPSQLSEVEKWSLLNDPRLLSRLHQSLWSGEAIHPGWQVLVKAV